MAAIPTHCHTRSGAQPEIGALFMAVLLGIIVAGDGRSTGSKGAQLLTVYVIIARAPSRQPDRLRR
jgi:hypothetical protein